MANRGGTGLSIGNFDIGLEVVENRIQLKVLQKMIDRLIAASSVDISQDEVDRFRQEAIQEINEEYPELGVEEQ